MWNRPQKRVDPDAAIVSVEEQPPECDLEQRVADSEDQISKFLWALAVALESQS